MATGGAGADTQKHTQTQRPSCRFDAQKRFGLKEHTAEDTSGCRCGEVLCGLIDPPQCELFEVACTPDSPVGPCMVSSEGACSAWYKYGRKRKRNQ